MPIKTKTAVICNNQAELSYMNEYLLENGMTEAWMGIRKEYPICVTLDGGWLDRLDRAINYSLFKDFIITINKE